MYSRVFVIKLLTGVVKANAKRVEVAQEPVLAFFFSVVEQCLFLNLELLALIESTFDLIYFFLSAGVTAPVHKLLSVLDAVTRLPVEGLPAGGLGAGERADGAGVRVRDDAGRGGLLEDGDRDHEPVHERAARHEVSALAAYEA